MDYCLKNAMIDLKMMRILDFGFDLQKKTRAFVDDLVIFLPKYSYYNVIKFIHASSSKGITIDTFNASTYYVPRFIKAKRLDYGEDEVEDLMIDDSMKED